MTPKTEKFHLIIQSHIFSVFYELKTNKKPLTSNFEIHQEYSI